MDSSVASISADKVADGRARILTELRKRLRMIEPEPLSPPGGDEDGPDRHYAVAATAFLDGRFFGAVVARTSSSHSWHSSSIQRSAA